MANYSENDCSLLNNIADLITVKNKVRVPLNSEGNAAGGSLEVQRLHTAIKRTQTVHTLGMREGPPRLNKLLIQWQPPLINSPLCNATIIQPRRKAQQRSPFSLPRSTMVTRSYRTDTTRPARKMGTQPPKGTISYPKELSQQLRFTLYTPSQVTRLCEGGFDLPKATCIRGRRCAPSQEKNVQLILPTCHKETDHFSTADDESNLTPNRPGSNVNSLQVKSLDGFSNNQLGRYCFNPETEFSHRGFRNPRLKLASFSQNNFLKMIIQQSLSNPPSSFLSFHFSFFLH
jgi:hypothetical protein